MYVWTYSLSKKVEKGLTDWSEDTGAMWGVSLLQLSWGVVSQNALQAYENQFWDNLKLLSCDLHRFSSVESHFNVV